jgi:hypothetical protein
VADVLYTKLRLPAPPLTSKGKHASTSEEALEALKARHPIVPLFLRYRALAKVGREGGREAGREGGREGGRGSVRKTPPVVLPWSWDFFFIQLPFLSLLPSLPPSFRACAPSWSLSLGTPRAKDLSPSFVEGRMEERQEVGREGGREEGVGDVWEGRRG